MVLLAAGLASAVARAAGLAPGSPAMPLVLAAAGVALRAGAGTLGEVLAARDGRRAEAALRRSLLTRLADSPAAVVTAGGTGPAAVLATTRLAGVGPSLATYLPALAQTLVVPPAVLLALAWTDLLSAVLVAVTLPLVPVFMVLVGTFTQDATADAARALDRIAAHVAELVRGLPVLVGLGRAADQAAALARLGEAHRSRTLATLRIAFLSSLVLELIATLSVALVAVTVGLRLVHGDLALAVGLTALLLAPEAFAPLRALGAAHHAAEDASLAAAEARAVLAAPVSSPVAAALDHDPRGADVAVTGLTVSYPGRQVPALLPLDLAVRPGELVALRGASGSGKSTLLTALAGLTDPGATVSGAVAGIPVGAVAHLPQFPRTTGATVADELRRHAGPEPGADGVAGDTHVAEALARVGASDLAGRAPESLSPGQLQLVALARALVRIRRGARLLLLDEPTAHLDDDAAATVTGVLAALHGTVTILLVTHDPALAALADRTVDLPSPPTVTGAATTSPRWFPPASRGPIAEVAAHDAAEPARGSVPARGATAKAVVAGTLSSGAGIALTAVSGWLIVRAAEMPPVLTLMVAIVAGRFLGLGRAVLRWLERMTAHDAALRLAAGLRVRVWRGLAAEGIAADRTPGSALARVIGDVGLVQDLTVRVRPPMLVAATVTVGTVAALAFLEPAAATVVATVLALTTALVVLVHLRLDAGAARAESALRVTVLRETTTVLEGLPDLRAHGLAGRAADDLAALAARQDHDGDTSARAAALGSGLVLLGTGLAAVLGTAVGAGGSLGGPALAAP